MDPRIMPINAPLLREVPAVGIPVDDGEENIVVVNVDWMDDGDDEDDTEGVGVAVGDEVEVVGAEVDVKVDGEDEGVAVAVDITEVGAGDVRPPQVQTPFVPSGIWKT
jgi:hypothetical protein